MREFILKEVINADLAVEFQDIGFDKSYIDFAINKFKYKNIKIFDVSPVQANIIKQTALSVGADCATHRDVITSNIEKSDCILGGSVAQFEKISDKLKTQPFGLKVLGEALKEYCIKNKQNSKTKIAGILNLTKNSFSDGGQFYDFDNAVSHLNEMINDGADIIDIGAESTKPYSSPVPADKQLELLLPIMDYINAKNINIPISIDTRSAKVAEECLKRGAEIINDVSGLEYDEKLANVVANFNSKVIIQHSKGTPETMQDNPVYSNLIDEIYKGLQSRIHYALEHNIRKENIIIDPGIGFGKTREANFEIIRRIEELYGLGCPVMLGISRKSLLNMPDEANEIKDIYTLAFNTLAVERKVDIIRVHNVKLHKKLLEIFR